MTAASSLPSLAMWWRMQSISFLLSPLPLAVVSDPWGVVKSGHGGDPPLFGWCLCDLNLVLSGSITPKVDLFLDQGYFLLVSSRFFCWYPPNATSMKQVMSVLWLKGMNKTGSFGGLSAASFSFSGQLSWAHSPPFFFWLRGMWDPD